MKWDGLFGRRKAAPEPPAPVPGASPRPLVAVPPACSLFHVTHWKAASQWMRGVLMELFGAALVPPELHVGHVWKRPIEPGRVYPCVYLAKPEFEMLEQPAPARYFVLIRDLRDTLVSAYFSLRHSHAIIAGEMERWRYILNRLPQEEGLLYLMETWLPASARIQRTWQSAGVRCTKVEECVSAPGALDRLFREAWQLEVPSSVLAPVLARHSFARLSGGRAPGQEDIQSHYRKGVAGDWREHFTPRLTARFKELYNDVLLLTGYESNEAWSAEPGVKPMANAATLNPPAPHA